MRRKSIDGNGDIVASRGPAGPVSRESASAPDPEPGREPSRELSDILRCLFQAVDEIRQQVTDRRKPFLTVEEVAKLTGRSEYTVRTWIKVGKLTATRVSGTGPK